MQAGLLLLLGLFAGTLAAPNPLLEDESRLYNLLENDIRMPEDDEQIQDDGAEEQSEAFILPVSKPLGEISGLAIDPKGRLVAFHRADREWDENSFDKKEVFNKKLGPIKNATIAIIDPSNGKVVEEHGQNMFYMPHGMTIDEKGNYWVTDVGSHQVHKLDSKFHPLFSLGEKLVPGDDEKHFCKPTDVAVAKNGYFFVADGYCNSRVLKFDPSGKLVDSFGAAGDEVGPSEFVIPHSLALIEDMNLICVADRENERVQCFSAGLAEGHRTIPAGIPITSAEHIGRVYAIREKKHYLIGVTGRDEEDQLSPQLFVMDMANGKADTFIKGIENAHSLAISDDGTVFISQMHPNQIIQISLPDQA
uniref:peptidylamidoglycolate lyase n=1 Tax=Haemonchus contortus TaxID=6289 RepID=A0A7I5E5I2_HAECO|nr:NHL repeat domain containing protein [Haemonchus contortus]